MKKYLSLAILPIIGGLSLLAVIPAVNASTNYTLAEVQAHNTATSTNYSSYWFINNDKVYDFSSFIKTLKIKPIGYIATSTDAIVPSIPINLASKVNNANRVKLTWTAATDNVAVAGYQIFRDNILVANTRALVFNDYKVNASTTYQYTVLTYDRAGNLSATSSALIVVTPAKSTSTLSAVINNHEKNDDNKDKKEYKKNDTKKEYKSNVNKFLKELRNNFKHNQD